MLLNKYEENQCINHGFQKKMYIKYTNQIYFNDYFRVEIDCRDIFRPGQLGVAMSRVRSVEGLRVINFHPKVCLPHSQDLHVFNAEPPLVPKDDLSCCHSDDR